MAWSQEQLANAAIIYSVGSAMGMSRRDIQTALITAMVESNLINVNYGDRDSLGLFQQRPSQGWGTPEQVQDPQYAARKFYTTLRALGDERYQMGMGEAAQAVQRSAYPDRYAERIGDMRAMWPTVQKSGGDTPLTVDGKPYDTSSEPSGGVLDGPKALEGGVTAGDVYSAAYGTDPLATPDPSQMLGAWGMGTNSLSLMEEDPLVQSTKSIISPATNASVIQPLAETTGSYEPGIDGWRKAVVQAAKTALGVPYVWGGENLSSGVDCSGLIQAAFAKVGISVPRISFQQANYGKRVGIDALQPGDLVAWENSDRNVGADHIAMYIGNGQIIEAAKTGTLVRIRSLGEGDENAWGVKISGKR